MTTRRTWLRCTYLLLSTALALTACGGGGGSGSDDSTDATVMQSVCLHPDRGHTDPERLERALLASLDTWNGLLTVPTPMTPVAPDAHDLQTALTHELGHVLGLGHSSDPDSIMWPISPGRGEQRRALTAEDAEAVAAIDPPWLFYVGVDDTCDVIVQWVALTPPQLAATLTLVRERVEILMISTLAPWQL